MTPPDERSSVPPIAVLVERMESIRSDLRRVESKIDRMADGYVTQDEFWPVKMIAYGFVGTILLSFVGLLVYAVGWHT